jgi:hypothetical protein
MASFKANRRVLLVGGEGVVLYAPSGKGIARETAIAWDVPGFDEQLADVLADKNSGKSVVVLFDGADQAYRKEENIPKLSPFDRPRFVKRKLELAFPSYPIRAALEIKPKKKKGARAPAVPPSYLFVALPETDNLDRVGKALFESGAPVAGFGLLPVESVGLVAEIAQKTFPAAARPSRWAVLIGQHETGGLRQVVVKDGNLGLSRLTPPTEAGTSGAGWVEEVMRSFKETMAYITRLGYTADDGLDVVVVCGDIEKQFFDRQAIAASNFKCLNPGEALALIGVKAFGLNKTNFADALHAAWAGGKRALAMPVRVPSIHRVMAPRLAARLATGVLVLAAVGLGYFAVDDYQSYLTTRDELAGKQNQLQMMQREYEQESQAFDKLPVKPALITGVLDIKKALEVGTLDTGPLFNKLKDALGGDIRLENLSVEHTPPGGFFGTPMGAPAAGAGEHGRVKMTFRFMLPEGLPLEQKVSRAEALQKDLQKAFASWDVKITAQFGRISRTGAFQGVVGGDAAKGDKAPIETAEFTMEGPAS